MLKLLALSCTVLFVAGPILVVGYDARIAAVWNAMNRHPTDGYGDQVEVQIYFGSMKADPDNPNGVSVDEFTRGWQAHTGDTATTCYYFFHHWDVNQNFYLDLSDLNVLFHTIDTDKDNRWDYLTEFYRYMNALYTNAPKSSFGLLL